MLRIKGSGKPFILDFPDLYSYNPELSFTLMSNPRKTLNKFLNAVESPTIQVRGMIQQTPIRLMGSSMMGGLVSIRGIVVKASQDTSRVSNAVYRCSSSSCYPHTTTTITQNTQFLTAPVDKCEECDEKKWLFDPEASTYRDSQSISIQETPDQLPSGEIPRKLDVQLLDNLVKTCNPGDLVEITGIVNVRRQSPDSFKLDLERYLEANHVEVMNKQDEGMNLTEKERSEIIQISKDEKVLTRFIHSLAPSIYGNLHIKEGIILQLFSSPAQQKSDIRIRGDTNILLCGDPSTSKSQLLKIATSIIPRGVFTTAGRSSKAGLTAAVVKDDKTGAFILEAGACVMADMSILGLDEIEKMDKNDRAALHPVMEAQIVKVDMAGISATLNARCAILGAGNPVAGRWNSYQTVSENINLPISLLSRFDLIFIMIDTPDVDRDNSLAEKVLGMDVEEAELLTREQMRRYILYARTINPEMPTEFKKRIRDFYVGLRKGSEVTQAIMITPRQLESIPRLSKAVARVHLHEKVTESDLDEALRLFKRSMEDVGIDPETGNVDYDAITTGKTRNLQDKTMMFLSAVRRISQMSIDHRAKTDDVKASLMAQGWSSDEYDRVEKIMERDGSVFFPSMGYVAVVV
jgi:replicative DNA helicase Mcm